MSDAIKMVAEVRHSFGKGAARKFRAAGRTPAVIYGHGTEPVHITVNAHEIALVLRHKNAVIELDIEGKPQTVLVKSATKDAVTQIIEHIDMVTLYWASACTLRFLFTSLVKQWVDTPSTYFTRP